ncbi:oxygenase MpaB family protein [Desertivirga arenae]|uniref:oxygenase MpaB family protein n=1 Tax=Desertivirga arenae TaxID=2810309 RepID=UPI001A96045F|nr:oxygenase MpaB family protein [Pedobacter sp. SYSU D00823]
MRYFVKTDSIVRKIWGKSDTILFIFAGASAEFALNKAVDWLYFTGKLPADPLGRLFSTVAYARRIVFSNYGEAIEAIEKITQIHATVEKNRGAKIPEWAYRDVLFMLIDYSIRSYEVLERELSMAEKEEVFDVFYRVGEHMGIASLPLTYTDWQKMRKADLKDNLEFSSFTGHLYQQYRKHLGAARFQLLKQAQKLVVPERVSELLDLGQLPLLLPVLYVYKLTRIIRLEQLLKNAILPEEYKMQVANLDIPLAQH